MIRYSIQEKKKDFLEQFHKSRQKGTKRTKRYTRMKHFYLRKLLFISFKGGKKLKVNSHFLTNSFQYIELQNTRDLFTKYYIERDCEL